MSKQIYIQKTDGSNVVVTTWEDYIKLHEAGEIKKMRLAEDGIIFAHTDSEGYLVKN